jgi:hypothetical protein
MAKVCRKSAEVVRNAVSHLQGAFSRSIAAELLLFRVTLDPASVVKKRGHRNEVCAPAKSNTSRWQASPADYRDRRAGARSRRLRTKQLRAAANAAHDLARERDQVTEQVAISNSTSAGFRSNRAIQFRRLRCEPQFARHL